MEREPFIAWHVQTDRRQGSGGLCDTSIDLSPQLTCRFAEAAPWSASRPPGLGKALAEQDFCCDLRILEGM